jgi:hypothetical protein
MRNILLSCAVALLAIITASDAFLAYKVAQIERWVPLLPSSYEVAGISDLDAKLACTNWRLENIEARADRIEEVAENVAENVALQVERKVLPKPLPSKNFSQLLRLAKSPCH